VLIVHGFYADGAGVVPRQKGHMVLRESLRLSAQVMLPAQVAAMGVNKWRFKRSSSVPNRDSAANFVPILWRSGIAESTLRLTQAGSSPKPAHEVFAPSQKSPGSPLQVWSARSSAGDTGKAACSNWQ
jgi:hypothetical protein